MRVSTFLWITCVGFASFVYVISLDYFISLANSKSYFYQWGWVGVIVMSSLYVVTIFFFVPPLQKLVKIILKDLND